ncbi:hypothetical protein LPJ61_005859, partial [Coemansia biformis]
MRYNSPTTQLGLLAAILLLTTANRRLLSTFLLQSPPTDLNPTYDSYLPTSIISCVAGFLGIFLVNLAGVRSILVFYSLTNILLLASIVSQLHTGHDAFHTAALIIDSTGYDLGRVATLVVVLAYPSERWKARALSLFLILEYFSMTIGDIIAMQVTSTNAARSKVAIAALCLACLAPFLSAAIAPSDRIVRNNGVYLLARHSTLREELRGTLAIFKNKYMMLMIPYMFAYPFLFSAANVPHPNIQAILLYDAGKIFIILMSLTLDIQWASRRVRSLVSLCMLTVVVVSSSTVTVVIRGKHADISAIQPDWTPTEINNYLMDQSMTKQRVLLLTTYFFAGLASSFIELFGYWIIGTLTNDIKVSGRLVGTYHSVMSIGGLVGYQMVNLIHHDISMSNIPTYIAVAVTFVSLVLLYFV